MDQPRLAAQHQHLTEQPRQRRLVTLAELSDRRMVRHPIGRDHPIRDVLLALAFDPPRRAIPARVRVEKRAVGEGESARGLGGGGSNPAHTHRLPRTCAREGPGSAAGGRVHGEQLAGSVEVGRMHEDLARAGRCELLEG